VREHPLYQITLCKVREFLREPEALFWVFIFPILLTLALGIAFRSKGPDALNVAVVSGPGADAALSALRREKALRLEVLPEARAREKLREGKVALVVVPGATAAYRFDPTREESRTARLLVNDALQSAGGRADPRPVRDEEITERGSRYIDFLVPGLLGMNLMGTGMWGIGFAIVQARSKKLLKRLISTPMRKSHYLLGQMLGRLFILFAEVGALLIFARFVFDVPFRGALATLFLVTVLGALTFSGFGLLVASRAGTIEGVSGLMNFVMLPMWILSGVFFSPSRFPGFLQPLIQALPLTALNDALRNVMIDGASLGSIAGELGILVAWGVASFTAALYLFRWR
jgi:ABC-type multidrug transport system permease subunit